MSALLISRYQKALYRRRAFSLVEMMIVVLIFGILLSIAVPNYTRARNEGRQKACIENLKNIDAAKEQWAMENRIPTGSPVSFTDLVGPTLYIRLQPSCPAGGTYTVNNLNTNPTCSIAGHVCP